MNDIEHLMEFTPVQVKCILSLANGVSIRQTALKNNVSRFALWNWRKDAKFIRAIQLEKYRLIEELTKQTINLKLKSVQTLNQYLDTDTIDISDKASIALYILLGLPSKKKIKL